MTRLSIATEALRMAMAILATTCASRSESLAQSLRPGPTPAAEYGHRVAASVAPRRDRPSARADCRTKATSFADVDHDGIRDQLTWTRCGPDDPTTLVDGSNRYPLDTLTVVGSRTGDTRELYTNLNDDYAERLAEVTPLSVAPADERVLVVAEGYGTGNVQNWQIVDVDQTDVRRWFTPPLDSALDANLRAGEYIGKQDGRAITLGHLELSWLVYRPGEPNCCPTGGRIKVRLVPGPNGLQVDRVWREPDR